jgi:cytochrome c nitrite reductase small subunit
MKISVVKGALIGAVLGIVIGVGGYTFVYAKGYSYLGHDSKACANCHVMRAHYDGWIKSSHRSVAMCNDCHTPSNVIGKYAVKADNGFWHSFAFTTGNYPDPLRIKPRNKRVTENACRKCHQEIVDVISPHARGADMSCIRCHRDVGHSL